MSASPILAYSTVEAEEQNIKAEERGGDKRVPSESASVRQATFEWSASVRQATFALSASGHFQILS